jgi:hypothetical protein
MCRLCKVDLPEPHNAPFRNFRPGQEQSPVVHIRFCSLLVLALHPESLAAVIRKKNQAKRHLTLGLMEQVAKA